MKALILSGGGARGAYEAGVIDVLAENETFDIVCGTSIGALNGLVVAQGAGDRLAEIWHAIPGRAVARLRPELAVLFDMWSALHGCFSGPLLERPRHALSTIGAFPRLRGTRNLSRLRGAFDSARVHALVGEYAAYSALRSALILGVTNLTTARGNAFAFFPAKHDDEARQFFFEEHDAEPMTAENYVDAVCASSALPPAFEPVGICCSDGVVRTFADGGFTNNAPLRQAIDAGATEITAILVDPPASTDVDHRADTIAHVASIMLEANTSRMLDLDLKLAARINDDVAAGIAPTKRHVSIRIIRPQAPVLLPVLNFDDAESIGALVEQGRADAHRSVAQGVA